MANRDALRRLSRTLPAGPEIDKIMDALRDKDDIHVAVMAVAIVEAHLEKLIVSRLHNDGKDLLSRLFQNRGPLSDFNSKILIAEAFGLITSPLAGELHAMRAIRNAFAHAKMPISFSDPPVAREVSALKTLQAIQREGNMDEQIGKSMELENKGWFLLATRLALIVLDEFTKGKGTADEILGEVLRSP